MESLASTDDLVAAHRDADRRVILGALLCTTGVVWLIAGGMLSASLPLGAVFGGALVPVGVGAWLLLRGASRCDAIETIVAESRRDSRRARRVSTRRVLRKRGAAA